MSEDKKQTDEKKYAQISQEFVRLSGESVGISDLNYDLTTTMAEDVNYRLREVIQNAGQVMRHSKRKKLGSEDLNKALRWSDVEPVYGYNSIDPVTYNYVKEAEVFCVEDVEIDLLLLANGNQAIEHPGKQNLKAQWLTIEGVQKDTSSSHGRKAVAASSNISQDLMTYYNNMTKAILGNNEELVKMALDDLKMSPKIASLLPYFINFVSFGVKKVSHDTTQLTKLLNTVRSLTSNHYLFLDPLPMLKMLSQSVLYCILEPLAASINPINDHWALRDCAAQLLVHIVRTWQTPVNQLYQNILQSLEEAFLDLTRPFQTHYGSVVALTTLGRKAVEKCILPNLRYYWPHLQNTIDDKSSNPQVRADAHKVLGALLLAAELLMLDFHFNVINFLEDEEPSSSSAGNRNLMANNESEINSIREEPNEIHNNNTNTNMQELTIKIEPDDVTKPSVSVLKKCDESTFGSDVYFQLYEYFGDALAARLPYVHLENFYTFKPDTLLNLFSTPELMKSGEELLEELEAKEEEMQSFSGGDEEHTDDEHDDNSLMSDDPEMEMEMDPDPDPETDKNVNLRIKSTVSDPTLGIKLTIAKLPRAQISSSSTESSSIFKQEKLQKLSIKILKEQLNPPPPVIPSPPPPPPPPPVKEEPFEYVEMKERYPYIDLSFEGSTPLPVQFLKRKGNVFTQLKLPCNSELHRISLKMKKISKRYVVSRRETFYRSLKSGSLYTVL